MVITLNKNDLLLIKDINYALQNSLLILSLYQKHKIVNENIIYQIKCYKKYINLTLNLLDNKKIKLKTIETIVIKLKFFLCSYFKLDDYFYHRLLDKYISKNMRRVILSDGVFESSSNDIKLIAKYYLSIDTRLLLEIRKHKDIKNCRNML
jgi:hypothetical protein